jgi:hypothetical protein
MKIIEQDRNGNQKTGNTEGGEIKLDAEKMHNYVLKKKQKKKKGMTLNTAPTPLS